MSCLVVAYKCARLRVGRTTNRTLEWLEIDMTLIMHNQARTLREHTTANLLSFRFVHIDAPKVSLFLSLTLGVGLEFLIGLFWQNFESSVRRTTANWQLFLLR